MKKGGVKFSKKEIHEVKKEWRGFYWKYFNILIGLQHIRVPLQQDGFNRLVIVAPSISINALVAAQRKFYRVYQASNENFDAMAVHNDRGDKPNAKPYAIWVRDKKNPDKKYRGANRSQKDKVFGETLRERILHGFKYWDETQSHLDAKSGTLCIGSRDINGDSPSVSSTFGDCMVYILRAGTTLDGGVREVVA